VSSPAVSQAYERARQCLRIARAHLTDWPASLDGWARKVAEARFWRAEARRLRRGIYHGSFCALAHDHEGECKL